MLRGTKWVRPTLETGTMWAEKHIWYSCLFTLHKLDDDLPISSSSRSIVRQSCSRVSFSAYSAAMSWENDYASEKLCGSRKWAVVYKNSWRVDCDDQLKVIRALLETTPKWRKAKKGYDIFIFLWYLLFFTTHINFFEQTS